MAVDPRLDGDLVAIPAEHLFEASHTHIGFRKGTFMRRFMFDFIEQFAPHLNRELVEEVMALPNRSEREALFEDIELPER